MEYNTIVEEEMKMKAFMNSLLKMTTLMAMMVTFCNVNATCVWALHQPKIPEGAMKYKK